MTTTLSPPAEQRFIIGDADWQAYEAILRALEGRHIFITYEKGRLELMAPSWKHDRQSRLLGLLVHHLAEHLRVPILGGGSTTFRREDLERGLEPDQCFYVRNCGTMRDVEQIDLQRDPPPDLAIEVEISQRLSDRLAVYAGIGVPELWRWDGHRLMICRLSAEGRYVQRDRGDAFPQVTSEQMQQLIAMATGKDDTAWSGEVRQWLIANVIADS